MSQQGHYRRTVGVALVPLPKMTLQLSICVPLTLKHKVINSSNVESNGALSPLKCEHMSNWADVAC